MQHFKGINCLPFSFFHCPIFTQMGNTVVWIIVVWQIFILQIFPSSFRTTLPSLNPLSAPSNNRCLALPPLLMGPLVLPSPSIMLPLPHKIDGLGYWGGIAMDAVEVAVSNTVGIPFAYYPLWGYSFMEVASGTIQAWLRLPLPIPNTMVFYSLCFISLLQLQPLQLLLYYMLRGGALTGS